MLWAGLLYETGLITLESALTKIFKQLRGLAVEDMFQLYKKIPLIPGVKEVFEKLKKEEYKTVLISSGLPQLFVEHLANELGAEYAFGLNLDVNEGRLTGRISGDVIQPNGKALVLEKIMKKEGLTPKECALVADDRNNMPMFKFCALKIGYNPDFVLSAKSDVVVKGDFDEVLPPIKETTSRLNAGAVSKRDIIRETIHIGGFFVPVVLWYLALDPSLAAFIIFIVTLLYTMSEIARVLGYNVPVASTITWNAAITPEIYEFVTSPIFFAVGIMLALIIFPVFSVSVGYASIAIFALGDGMATLFGKKLGRHVFPYNKGKKIEGTLFGFLFAWLGATLFIVNPLKALVGAAVGMFVETLPTPVNDNLTIPLISGLTLLIIP
jgi:HAD superfamily phosphoserine phosphatase-like hydrolase